MLTFKETIAQIRQTNPNLANKLENNGGFVVAADLPAILKIDRNMRLLVRCGCGRFTSAADSVEHFTSIIKEHADLKQKASNLEFAGDYVRDVSIPA